LSDGKREELDSKQRLAQEAVRSLGAVAADPAFRERLQRRFLSGDMPEAASAPRPVASRPRRVMRFALAAVAAAAVLALAVVLLNRLPGPELLAVKGGGSVEVDGRLFDTSEAGDIGAALKPASHLVLKGEAVLDVLYPGSMAMRLEPGTDFILPGRPGRWFDRRPAAELKLGELSVRTGSDLAGGALIVSTPEGRVTIAGTLVSIFRNRDLTCVCLFEGKATVATPERDLGPVPLLKRWVVFNDGREPVLLDIEPSHLDHMLLFDKSLNGALKRD
jgi:hypothetical protein